MNNPHDPDFGLPPKIAKASRDHKPGWKPNIEHNIPADQYAELEADLDEPWPSPEAEDAYNAWRDTLEGQGINIIPDRDPPVEPSAAERIPQPTTAEPEPLPGGPLRARLIRGQDILNIPQPPWLVEGLIQEASVTELVGAPGCGKTFAALDLALCVLTQQRWEGHTTNTHPTRPVLWLAGEGLPEIGLRIRAWCAHHDVDVDSIIDRFIVLPGGGNVSDQQMAMHLRELTGALDMQPQLIVVDTLSRHSLGVQENNATDMELVFDTFQQMAELDAALVIIHHTGKAAANGGRGSSAVDGHIRSMLTMTAAKGAMATISHTKSNNAGTQPGWVVELVPAGIDPTTGKHLSMVPVVAETRQLGAADRIVSILIREDIDGKGVKRAALKDAAMATHMAHSTFQTHLNNLLAEGRVAKHINNGWYYVPDNHQPEMI